MTKKSQLYVWPCVAWLHSQKNILDSGTDLACFLSSCISYGDFEDWEVYRNAVIYLAPLEA